MGMTTSIDFDSVDSIARKAEASKAIESLTKLNQEISPELYDIRDSTEKYPEAFTEIVSSSCNGFTVDLTKLPKHITLIHFKNCY